MMTYSDASQKPFVETPKLGFEFSPLVRGAALLLKDKGISRGSQFVYLYLLDQRNGFKRGIQTFPQKISEIANDLGYAVKTVKNAITELGKQGLTVTHQSTHTADDSEAAYTFRLPVYACELVDGARVWYQADARHTGKKERGQDNHQTHKQTTETQSPHPGQQSPESGQQSRNSGHETCDKSTAAQVSEKVLDSCLENTCIESLSPVIPVPDKEEVIRGKTTEVRERDFCDLFYEHAMGKKDAIIDRQKRRRINRQCKQLAADIASRIGIDHAQAVLIDAFQRVRGYDPYSFGIMSADYGERCIEAAINAHLSATTAENVTTLSDTASNEGEPCDTSDEHENDAHTSNVKHSIRNPQSAIRNPLSVEERIRYLLTATKYQNHDHAVAILQRKDNTLSRDDIIRVLEAVDKERASKVPLLRRLSPNAVIETVGRSVSEAADVMGALAHLRGMRTTPAMGG